MAHELGTGLPTGVHPSSSSSAAPSPSPKKRQALDDEFKFTTVRVARSTLDKPGWSDMPHWGRSRESYFLGAPAAPTLTLRDHLALAATCRALRSCYWTAPGSSTPDNPPASALWAGLAATRPCPIDGVEGARKSCSDRKRRAVMRIFSGGARADAESFDVVGKAEDRGVGRSGGKKRAAPSGWEGKAIRSFDWERAILLVDSSKSTKTDAKKHYKLTDNDLKYLKAVVKPNPHARRSGAPMNLFVESAVGSLALRLHGGVRGHEALLAKRAASAAKAAATRAANGTSPGRSRKGKAKGKASQLSVFERELLAFVDAEMGSYPGWDYGDYGECEDWGECETELYDGDPECG